MRPSSKRLGDRAAWAPLLAASLLAGCGMFRKGSPDNEPTLRTLAGRQITIEQDSGVTGSEEKAIAAYTQFLDAAPNAKQRLEARRRLGDLEMDASDNLGATGNTGTDYKAAVKRYEDFLKTYPTDPGNDRVLYQLARAHEQSGDNAVSLKTLDRLLREYPKTRYRDEAQFRRGELLFTARDYVNAGEAYATVLRGDDAASPYRQRSLYMQGWSYFKQSRLEESLRSFFGVLDLKLGDREDDGPLDTLAGLSRADRELLEDTFRVTSLALQQLQGAESIPAYIDSPARKRYEYRVYQELGELYLKQERIRDAADTFTAFAKLHPQHAQAPQLQARVIEIYERAKFETLAMNAKRQYVANYGPESALRRSDTAAWQLTQPLVKKSIDELARYSHRLAQKSKAPADYQEAARWYRAFIASFPTDALAPADNFLLAELLFESGQFAEAATEYEKTAYDYPTHAKSADAGFGALQSDAALEKRVDAAALPAVKRAGVTSALRFAQAFPNDPRTAAVLTNAAEALFALKDPDAASTVAQRVLAMSAPATPPTAAQRRVAGTVVAHTAFERGAFDRAERAYTEVIALTPTTDPARAELNERLAASIYKQGEQARAAGKQGDAASQFARVGNLAPNSAVRANAQYDQAAAQISMKDWGGAAKTLEDFRARYPGNALQEQVTTKLAVVYTESGQTSKAAAEFERLSAANKDPQQARVALWQAAELYDKAEARPAAARTYERYLKQYPQPLERAIEARSRLVRIAHADGNAARELALQREILQADQTGGAGRTDRTRYLGATAALALAQPVVDEYQKVQLVEPLARQLKLKKTRMEDALKAYAVAADYGVADVSTAATYHTAALYQSFGKAMLQSQRPAKLSKIELEQYNVLLEEQAFPMEEKATELHELNARRAASGVYDDWVKKSFVALGSLRPVRYGKAERGEGVVDAIR